MMLLRSKIAIAVLVAGLLPAATFATGEPREYKLGDVAGEDVITPVTLRVVNPDASEVLKQKAAAQVPLIFRRVGPAADEAEAEMRASIETARAAFLPALRQALHGRVPNAGDVDSPAYLYTVRVVTREAPKNPPLSRLAPLWVRGVSDEALVDALLQPVREVMAQPIVNNQGEDPLPLDQPVRLIWVKNMLEAPSMQELETAGATSTAADLSSLESARSAVETCFSPDQDDLARFAAAFVRPNTYPAPGLTELLRARRRDGISVYDTLDAGQIIVRKGQTINRKALSALAAVRERNLMESLLTRVEPRPPTDARIITPTEWLGAGFGAACLALLLILWRWGARPRSATTPVLLQPVRELPALLGDENGENWRTRALIAENRAERAHEAIRMGALGWMREKVFRSLFRQRAELLSIQQLAEAEVRELEGRLEQLLVPLQGRIKAYEKRIEELEKALAAQGGKDHGLIGTRITVTRQQLEAERERLVRNY